MGVILFAMVFGRLQHVSLNSKGKVKLPQMVLCPLVIQNFNFGAEKKLLTLVKLHKLSHRSVQYDRVMPSIVNPSN